MSPDEIVRTFINHIEAKNLDAACSLLTDDCEYDNVPMSKVFGIEAVKQVLGPFVLGDRSPGCFRRQQRGRRHQ